MTYVVQSGDTLFTIAKKFNTTVASLIALNPQITNPNLIYPGQSILIRKDAIQCPLLRQGDQGPMVRRLQLLLQFARFNPGPIDGIFGPKTQAALLAFQHSQKELEITGVADQETWTALGAECETIPEVTRYVVRPGDTLFIIATRFNITIEAILSVNPEITDPDIISAGQVINIPER